MLRCCVEENFHRIEIIALLQISNGMSPNKSKFLCASWKLNLFLRHTNYFFKNHIEKIILILVKILKCPPFVKYWSETCKLYWSRVCKWCIFLTIFVQWGLGGNCLTKVKSHLQIHYGGQFNEIWGWPPFGNIYIFVHSYWSCMVYFWHFHLHDIWGNMNTVALINIL